MFLEIALICIAVLLIANLALSWKAARSNSDAALVQMRTSLEYFEKLLKSTETAMREEIARYRAESAGSAKDAREELSRTFAGFSDAIARRIVEIAGQQKGQLELFSKQLADLMRLNEQKLDTMRDTIEVRVRSLQEENSRKLDQMRDTVDEKLQTTLEKRLGESFKLVSERLEMVHKGLGEMQGLASDVGDLKKVLTNVKSRGVWGEIQLGNLLEQVLTAEQYEKNVAIKERSQERVEFAIKLPGRGESARDVVWLPIDAKFPQEDYQRLVDAQERANPAMAEEAAKRLEGRIKLEAKAIREKYIDPPQTTDFAIMYLPTEGLYAEVIRRPGLADSLQREYRVVAAGPTTLTALLNSLQMGFRTLAIEKRSSEVWKLLGVVKTEFGRFGDMLDKTHKKLQEASDTIVDATRKTRTIESKLKKVQELPVGERGAITAGEE
ncbi:MAG TPA: DNA recombination protein RmuC [Spirochaetota bacterium]|nr:DNA recombination protein RmuC [Spirochaetota bacterium]